MRYIYNRIKSLGIVNLVERIFMISQSREFDKFWDESREYHNKLVREQEDTIFYLNTIFLDLEYEETWN